MRTWSLLQLGEHGYVDTGETVQADSFGRAVELLLPAEMCASPTQACALTLDIAIGTTPPDYFPITCATGVFKVVPVASNDIAHLARMAQLVEHRAAEVRARLDESGAA